MLSELNTVNCSFVCLTYQGAWNCNDKESKHWIGIMNCYKLPLHHEFEWWISLVRFYCVSSHLPFHCVSSFNLSLISMPIKVGRSKSFILSLFNNLIDSWTLYCAPTIRSYSRRITKQTKWTFQAKQQSY